MTEKRQGMDKCQWCDERATMMWYEIPACDYHYDEQMHKEDEDRKRPGHRHDENGVPYDY